VAAGDGLRARPFLVRPRVSALFAFALTAISTPFRVTVLNGIGALTDCRIVNSKTPIASDSNNSMLKFDKFDINSIFVNIGIFYLE
jgi:hypothetical protein